MVEDNLDNLRTAKRLGMKTVWVGPGVSSPAGVDVSIRALPDLPRMLSHLAVS
jgi:putative hydrolase of the HAD superfamily